jgi:penicillin-binding protein 2
VYDLVVEPTKVRKSTFDTLFLCKLLNLPIEDFDKQFKKMINKYGWQTKSIALFKNLSPNKVARLQENLYEFEGVDLIEHAERLFTYNCGGSILGFINEINEKQLQDTKYANYEKGDYIGV